MTNLPLRKIRQSISSIGFLCTLTATSTQAATLLYEGFDYGESDGSLTTTSGGAWTQISSAGTAEYVSSGLSYGSLVTSGGAAQTNTAWDGGTTKQFRFDFTDIDLSSANEVWISFLVQTPGSVGTNTSAQLSVSMLRNSWGSYQNYGAGKSYGNNTAYTSTMLGSISGAEFANVGSDTLLLVYRFTRGSAGELWLNPTIGGSTPTPGTGIALTDTTNTSLTSIQYATISFLGQEMVMDELRIGDTFADVTPVNVPEPTTTALLLLAGIGGYTLLRRRSTRDQEPLQ
ncbi:PEP-CTERM sorting domain-containing protein [Cerasicoccus frondis]|uniref:PEP-CTERM sorting domain-containing protein n=1 Tax=Cerasicoccus frondis TaxID=490090 RepID=UPI0028525C9F|nr:PEP-CTERM sorting domain-containing protein [Cerasicoccus frondis]